ncbi:MAG: hypothetical protein SR1Q5_02135, partial [Quinella sp. 1Q5]|nr:hypothetical protein [Quinella sp. 1Q5]
MDTKKITVIPVGDETFTEYQDANLKKVIARTNDGFNDMLATLYQEFAAKFQAKEWIYLNRAGQGEGVYYVNDIAGLLPDLDVHVCNYADSYRPIAYNDPKILSVERLTFAGFKGVIPTRDEARKLFNDQLKYFRDGNGNVKVHGGSAPGVTVDNGNCYMWTNNTAKYNIYSYNGSNHNNIWVIPIYKFGLTNPTVQKVLWTWLEYDLTPKDFPSDNSKKLFATLKKYKAFFKLAGDKITFDERKVFE